MLRIADKIWIAAALMQREHHARRSFKREEIVSKLNSLRLGATKLSAVHAYFSGRRVPCYLHSEHDETLRLARPSDNVPGRSRGRFAPEKEQLPVEYQTLVDWYWTKYAPASNPSDLENDPVLKLRGVGKELWGRLGGGDAFIRGLRENWYGAPHKQPHEEA